MGNETNIGGEPGAKDMRVTRLPFEQDARDAAGWLPENEISLWSLADPIHGSDGSEIDRLVVSAYSGDDGAETAVIAANEDGSPYLVGGLFPAPFVAVREGVVEAAELLTSLGFEDVTAA